MTAVAASTGRTIRAPLPVFRGWLAEGWRGLIGWAIGLTAVALVYLPLFPTMQSPELSGLIETLPPELVRTLGYENITSGAGYAQATFFGLIGFVLMTIAGIGWGASFIAGAEESGRLELTLAHGVGRLQYALESAAALVVKLLALGLVGPARRGGGERPSRARPGPRQPARRDQGVGRRGSARRHCRARRRGTHRPPHLGHRDRIGDRRRRVCAAGDREQQRGPRLGYGCSRRSTGHSARHPSRNGMDWTGLAAALGRLGGADSADNGGAGPPRRARLNTRRSLMLASDIQVTLPLVDRGTSAVAAARHIARDHLAALVVADASGTPIGVVSSADVLGLLVPSYVLQDMSLAGVLDEAGAEEMWSYADNRTIGELLDDDGVRVRELLSIDGDSTLIETAALMVDAHAQVAVVKGTDPAMFVTLPAVMDAILTFIGEPGAPS